MSPPRPMCGFRFTLADLLCVVAFVAAAVGLPISFAQVIDLKHYEKVLPFGSQPNVSVVIVDGHIVLSGWQLAIRKLTPVPHLLVLGAVGFYARRRTKSKANGPVSLDRSLRDPAAVSPADSPAVALPDRDTAGNTVRCCFACMGAAALLALGVALLILILIWFGPVPTFGPVRE